MTTVIPNQPPTTSARLFGETQDTGQALAQALDEKGVLGSLGAALQQVSQAGRQAADRQVATVAHGLLDLDLGDLVVAGWRKQAALAAAVERTIANPGSTEVVELATHRLARRQEHFELPLLIRWPLRLHPGGGDPAPSGARRPSASSPSLRPSRPTNHPVRRQRRRHLDRRARPAD